MTQYKSMDRTSAAYAKAMDKRREAAAKKRKQQKLRDRTSLSRGGFRD